MPISESFQKGAYHIATNAVEYNPQRKNNFSLVVQGLTNLARLGSIDPSLGTLGEEDIIANGQEQLILALRSTDVPTVTQNPIEINRGNSTIKFAGKPSFNTLNMEFYDYIGSDVKDTLLAWQHLSYNRDYDYTGNAASYKKDCQLLQLTPKGEIVRYWDIKGAWLQTVEPGNFSMDSGDEAQTVSATLCYDWAEMHTPDDYIG